MAKQTYYFSHDYNVRNDEKIKLLIRKHGMIGYGIYWAIVEDLYNNANALRTDYDGIAFDLRVQSDIVASVVQDFNLFEISDLVSTTQLAPSVMSEQSKILSGEATRRLLRAFSSVISFCR